MYKNILIPIVLDTTRNTVLALEVAKTLADEGASFTLLHSEEIMPVYVAEYLPTEVVQANRESVKAEMEALSKELPGSRIALTNGRAGSEICRYAEENGCDCIVIASHRPEFSDIFLGSTAQHVVRHAASAVHVIR